MGVAYDLVVIGMGSGGTQAAAFAAGDLGLRVAAVERARIGGDCLWTGCVPSKALVASARAAHLARHASRFGVGTGEVDVDLGAVWERIREVQASIAATDDSAERFRELGVDVVEGTARVTAPREVTVDHPAGTRVLTTRHVLVCTGSRPTIPPIAGLADTPFLTSEDLFELDRPPASVVLIGGGPVGSELAQAFVRLGVPTTVLEAGPRLLGREEPELSERLTTILRGEGVDVRLATTASEVRRGGDGVVVVAGDREVTAAGVVVAAGRTANVDALGLDRLGIVAGPRGAEVDGRSRTVVPNVYVVGDAAAGRPRFTHSAAHDAVLAVRDMFFPGRGLAARLVPRCTFTDPELASVGLTAAAARETYGPRTVRVHRRDLAHDDRARADGATDGTLIVVTVGDRIVGAHALGPAAGELIGELTLAISYRLRLGDLAGVVHAYPTYAGAIGQLAAAAALRRGRRYRALTRVTRWLG